MSEEKTPIEDLLNKGMRNAYRHACELLEMIYEDTPLDEIIARLAYSSYERQSTNLFHRRL
jgi:hypothetical protein